MLRQGFPLKSSFALAEQCRMFCVPSLSKFVSLREAATSFIGRHTCVKCRPFLVPCITTTNLHTCVARNGRKMEDRSICGLFEDCFLGLPHSQYMLPLPGLASSLRMQLSAELTLLLAGSHLAGALE